MKRLYWSVVYYIINYLLVFIVIPIVLLIMKKAVSKISGTKTRNQFAIIIASIAAMISIIAQITLRSKFNFIVMKNSDMFCDIIVDQVKAKMSCIMKELEEFISHQEELYHKII